MTSAIHDAQNLCWKVAAVLAGEAAPALLGTYEAERRRVDQRNAQRSLENALNDFADRRGELGVSHENTREQNMEQLRRMWSSRPADSGHRSSVLRAMRAQSMEFSELNVEYCYCYEYAAVVRDGSAALRRPTTSACISRPPGQVLPCRTRGSTTRTATTSAIKDLVARGRFLLIAGEDGLAWCEAAEQLAAKENIPLDAVRIGHLDGDLFDPRCAWLRYREIASDGAILVRSERFIAWRQATGTDEPQAALAAALS